MVFAIPVLLRVVVGCVGDDHSWLHEFVWICEIKMMIVWSFGCEHSESRRSFFFVKLDLIDVALVAIGDLKAVAEVRDLTFLNLIETLLPQGSLRR